MSKNINCGSVKTNHEAAYDEIMAGSFWMIPGKLDDHLYDPLLV